MTEVLKYVDADQLRMLEHLVLALGAGALIGMERSYHGRPAGFRTHALVCLASAPLMTVTLFQHLWFIPTGNERVTLDPTRMAQGIMTGIGFLGAGVIMKEGLSVRGLTTAASIWITASIGILIGVGFYFPAAIATVLVLATLTVFRKIEMMMPTLFYAQLIVRFKADNNMSEQDLRGLVGAHGFSVTNLNYRLDRDSGFFEYQMAMRAPKASDARRLSEQLTQLDKVVEFRISPTGD
jgi:putative Mg2+ transporter-C (MgtC) family protein